MAEVETKRIVDGIEFFRILRHDGNTSDLIEDCQCARCGSSCAFVSCDNCGGEGWTEGHTIEGWESDDPDDMDRCDWCRGTGGGYRCLSGREWCRAHPMPGRESIETTAAGEGEHEE